MSKRYYAALAKKKRQAKKAQIDRLKVKLENKELAEEERVKIQRSIEKIKKPKPKQKKANSVWTVSGGLPSLGKKK